MNKIKVSLTSYAVNGKQISFIAPCGSADTECLIIQGVEYAIVDADNISVSGLENVWYAGALVSAILNVDTRTAFIQNANTNPYIESQFQTQTQKLIQSDEATLEDTMPLFSQSQEDNRQITLNTLRKTLGAYASIRVKTCEGAEVVCADGSTSLTSVEVNMVVNGEFTITAQPVDYVGEIGDTSKFIINTNKSNATYQWQQNTGAGWVDVNTTMGRSNTFSVGVAEFRLGYLYRCVVSDGTNTLISDEVQMIVEPDLVITTQPVNFIGSIGDTATFTAEATGENLTYQWEYNSGAGWTHVDTKEGRSNTINVEITELTVTYRYRCRIFKGEPVFTGSGSTTFYPPHSGTWIVTSTLDNIKVTKVVDVVGLTQYTVDLMLMRSIRVATPPVKTSYIIGEAFIPTGMKVVAVYMDNVSRIVEGWSYSPVSIATLTDTSITISYTENDITKTCTQEIQVSNILSTIEITTPPTKLNYYESELFDTTGMVVTAIMADGSTKTVTDYTYTPKIISGDTTEITIYYTEDGVTKTCVQEIEITPISPILDQNSWETIRFVSDAGLASNYWSIGDWKSINIKGTVVGTSFNCSLDVFIIGFDHNKHIEGTNRIHFQLGRDHNLDIPVVLCADNYDPEKDATTGFVMNTTAINTGGWRDSYCRTNVLGNSSTPNSPLANSLLAALPSDLRAVMKSVRKYAAIASGDITNVVATTDYLFLLACDETHNTGNLNNKNEQYYVTMYEYYAAGNSKFKYQYNNTDHLAFYWTRSLSGTEKFCAIDPYVTGNLTEPYYEANPANRSFGISPGFCV